MILTVLIVFAPLALLFRGLRHWLFASHLALLALISWWKFPSLQYALFHPYYVYFLGGLHLAFITAITFAAYGWDKKQARQGGWRIPEKTLHQLSFIGGTAGAWLGSKFFRHKTIKGDFKQMFVAVLIAQCFIIALAIWIAYM